MGKILLPRVQFRARIKSFNIVSDVLKRINVEQLTDLHNLASQDCDGYEMALEVNALDSEFFLGFLEQGKVYTFVVDLWARNVYKSGEINYLLIKTLKS